MMERRRINGQSKIPPNHVGCAWLGVKGRNRFEISNGGECTQRKKRRVMFCGYQGWTLPVYQGRSGADRATAGECAQQGSRPCKDQSMLMQDGTTILQNKAFQATSVGDHDQKFFIIHSGE